MIKPSLFCILAVLFASPLLAAQPVASVEPLTAKDIVRQAIDHWRGSSSYTEMSMLIKRPSWQRSMSLRAWTQGTQSSLIRITAPKKDQGNATLLKDKAMWSYSPKINRVIKVPSSMMAQSWMGSDFSNKDVTRSDDIVEYYRHTLIATESFEGHEIYTIEAVPLDDAPIVWGREVLRVRDDFILLEQQYFDQEGAPVKRLETLSIAMFDGRELAQIQRMSKHDKVDEWTEVSIQAADFDIDLRPTLFSLANLRNPRD